GRFCRRGKKYQERLLGSPRCDASYRTRDAVRRGRRALRGVNGTPSGEPANGTFAQDVAAVEGDQFDTGLVGTWAGRHPMEDAGAAADHAGAEATEVDRDGGGLRYRS